MDPFTNVSFFSLTDYLFITFINMPKPIFDRITTSKVALLQQNKDEISRLDAFVLASITEQIRGLAWLVVVCTRELGITTWRFRLSGQYLWRSRNGNEPRKLGVENCELRKSLTCKRKSNDKLVFFLHGSPSLSANHRCFLLALNSMVHAWEKVWTVFYFTLCPAAPAYNCDT